MCEVIQLHFISSSKRVEKLGWKDHTKIKDIFSLLVLYEIYLGFFKRLTYFLSVNKYL